ncbi:hypothetical protein [Kiritimatiella glycovorans]|uniref:DUF4412 domain-containing protein n=1 Tax=Kiritimatiella glycovorans TaxID=1307763 RepID=A0A0G3EF40_9BACT|nr:hypothetical protein [Kiritimatiella glycovorans]AKJ63385.1 hypothetical protein L21SP4_00099 [Kiritimatiella glycovorans]
MNHRASPCLPPLRTTAAVLLAGLFSAAALEAGVVEFSDGSAITGEVRFASADVKLHYRGKKLIRIPADEIAGIRLRPERESLERKWMMPTAGQTRKERWGEPFPVRHLKADLLLAGGQRREGHLYTTPLYVLGPEGAEKVVLPAKQRGEEGQTLAELVYPVAVRTDREVAAEAAERTFRLPEPLRGAEPVVLQRDTLTRLPVRREGDAWRVTALPGEKLFAAVRRDGTVTVGWPERRDPALFERMNAALAEAKDFFDRRELLGVVRGGEDSLYALCLLSREGATTLKREKNRPWRVGIWRWKEDGEDGRIMLAGRGFFFRGIETRGVRPEVRLSPELHAVMAGGGGGDGTNE